MTEFFFTAPYPPSVNHYWLTRGRYKFLSERARAYTAAMQNIVSKDVVCFKDAPVSLDILVFPPDKRKRDIDNILKPILDSLAKAGVYDDDSQVHCIRICRAEQVKNGKIEILIKNFTKTCALRL